MDMYIKLLVATILGGIVGMEREVHDKAAGLRTHMLVCLGSCLITITSIHMYDLYKGIGSVSPERIAAQIVSGIGFLGAGTIIRSQASIVGLTTAASLWAVAGIGLALGTGLYLVSIFTTAIMIVSLKFLPKIKDKVIHQKRED